MNLVLIWHIDCFNLARRRLLTVSNTTWAVEKGIKFGKELYEQGQVETIQGH